MNKKPNKFFAPIVIAGVTIGFLASAYKFVFAKPEKVQKLETEVPNTQPTAQQNPEQESDSSH